MDIVEFLHDVLKIEDLPGEFRHAVSVHNSCHGVRELGLSSPSERNIPSYNKIIDLLKLKSGITVYEPDRKDECCGFGGMFAVEEARCLHQDGRGQDSATHGYEPNTSRPDSSCLMHMQGIAKKEHKNIKFIHVAEILAAGL